MSEVCFVRRRDHVDAAAILFRIHWYPLHMTIYGADKRHAHFSFDIKQRNTHAKRCWKAHICEKSIKVRCATPCAEWVIVFKFCPFITTYRGNSINILCKKRIVYYELQHFVLWMTLKVTRLRCWWKFASSLVANLTLDLCALLRIREFEGLYVIFLSDYIYIQGAVLLETDLSLTTVKYRKVELNPCYPCYVSYFFAILLRTACHPCHLSKISICSIHLIILHSICHSVIKRNFFRRSKIIKNWTRRKYRITVKYFFGIFAFILFYIDYIIILFIITICKRDALADEHCWGTRKANRGEDGNGHSYSI